MLPRSCWWISPLRTLRRRILAAVRSVVVAMVLSSQSGGRRFPARCGRWWLWCATYSSRAARRCRGPAISIWSVTSARAVRTQRSATAFALGRRCDAAGHGVRSDSGPPGPNHRITPAGLLAPDPLNRVTAAHPAGRQPGLKPANQLL